ncbi:MAG: DNA internalization-related competence protein ComEC/Rec2 [Eubacteriales bacterium]
MRTLMYFSIGFSLVTLALVAKIPIIFSIGMGILLLLAIKCNPVKLKCLVVGGVLAAGYFIWYTHSYHLPLAQYDNNTIRLTAVVVDFPQETDYGYSVLTKAELEKNPKTLLYFDEKGEQLVPGDTIEIITHLSLSDTAKDGTEITYYTSKGILLVGQTYGSLKIEENSGSKLPYYPAFWAKMLKENIQLAFPSEAAAVVEALVLGNRDNLTDQFSTSLQRTGLTHTVAVSGMHFAFLAGFAGCMLPRGKWWSALFLIALVVTFMFITGATPSIIRATIMIVLLHIAPFFRRERDGFNSLSVAVLLILLQNPYTAVHLGLQLSLCSVAGIFLFGEKVGQAIYSYFGENTLIKGAISLISTTLSAMLFTTPLLAVYFGSISLIAPISNLATLWAVSLLFSGGLIVAVVAGFSVPIAKLMATPILPLVEYLNWVVEHLARSPFAAITMDSVYYKSWLLMVYSFVMIGLLTREKKRLLVPICATIFAFSLAILLHSEEFLGSDMSVKVLDVGQGQAVLFGLGANLVLVDCGGSHYEGAENIAADAIGDLGRSGLDLLVITHCHADHAGGVVGLMERVSIQRIAMPYPTEPNEIQDEILREAQEKGVEIIFVTGLTTIQLDEFRTIQLFPPVGEGDMNETGVTALVSVLEQDVLITGDMSAETELALIDGYKIPDIEVLLVGHHGSNYSSDMRFLEEITPEYAVISLAEGNLYGHPHADVMERLKEVGASIYRTDQSGNITLTLRGEIEKEGY